MSDEQLEALVNEIAHYGGTMGGLDTSTMYGEFALDVAKAVRERCATLCEQVSAEGQMLGGEDAHALVCAERIRGSNVEVSRRLGEEKA